MLEVATIPRIYLGHQLPWVLLVAEWLYRGLRSMKVAARLCLTRQGRSPRAVDTDWKKEQASKGISFLFSKVTTKGYQAILHCSRTRQSGRVLRVESGYSIERYYSDLFELTSDSDLSSGRIESQFVDWRG